MERFEAQEILAHLFNVDADSGDCEEKLDEIIEEEMYGNGCTGLLEDVVLKLFKMINIGASELTGERQFYIGFSKHIDQNTALFLAKRPVELPPRSDASLLINMDENHIETQFGATDKFIEGMKNKTQKSIDSIVEMCRENLEKAFLSEGENQ